MRRLFSNKQRRHLYRQYGGRCARCGTPLASGWHADHMTPYSAGGSTNVANGQPLCPTCNLTKGTTVDYRDSFTPRPFQQDVIESVLDGFATGRKVTVALGTPGTGKTLAYQSVATYLIREDLINYIAVFVPRVSLAEQCEISWLYMDRDTRELHGHHAKFDAAKRLGKIRHTDATPPLTQPGATRIGFVSTYSALVTNPVTFADWAEEHRGRFLLVADEAQFCGGKEELGGCGGTRSGSLVEELADYAAHTLLLTGTPYRADKQPLVLATYTDDDENGRRRLVRQVEATYADGIDGEYLRTFEMQMHEGVIKESAVGGDWSVEYQMSSRESNLIPVLRLPTTWQPLVELVVQSVREKQVMNPDYRGLISCIEKKDAEAVVNYLRGKHPNLRVHLAVSADGAKASKALKDFKTEPADLLVTVRMAFIGYDCPLITVVGVLTHYRDKGHLMQLVGRGLRVWDDEPFVEQSCRIIAPDDPRMQDFLMALREEQDEGIRRRKLRESDADRPPTGEEGMEPLTFIEATRMTSVRAISNDAELEHDERMLIEAAKHQLGLSDDATKLAAFAELLGIRQKNTGVTDTATVEFGSVDDNPPATATPMTDKQHIEQIRSQVAEEVRGYLADRGILPGRDDYGMFIRKVTTRVNKAARCTAETAKTIEQHEGRLAIAKTLRSTA